jgi:hypothetical protein
VTTLPTIVAGDTIKVQINNGPVNTITVQALTAVINLGTNQVTGTGPPSTSLTLGVGRIDGFVTNGATFNYVQQQVTSTSGGSFASTTISCGSSGNQILQPGSFGYVLYEDPHGNSPYFDFAAPRVDVMANFPYVEGWMAVGTSNPIVSSVDANHVVKSPATPASLVLVWLNNQQLFLNTYFNQVPAQFNATGDTVTVSQTLLSGATRTDNVTVDSLTTYVNTDASTIVGTTSAGTTVRMIPYYAKSVYQTAVADSTGNYTVANPFLNYNDSTCSTGSTTQTFSPGNAGRTYITHGDGNQVFANWGRAMHILENSNQVELYLYPLQNVDMLTTSSNGYTSTVAVTTTVGTSVSYVDSLTGGQTAYVKAFITDSGHNAFPIQNGADVVVSFVEGPPGGPLRPATISLGAVPLITAAPDFTKNTLAGTGPPSWPGQTIMTVPNGAAPVSIPARGSSAWGPFSFSLKISQGDTFTVSFSDGQSNRVWNVWTATSYPVEISPQPKVGDLTVCGTAQPNASVTLLNVSDGVHQYQIGGPATVSGVGQYCITVNSSTPLYRGEVVQVLANGTYSQPVVVIAVAAFLPVVY